MELYSAAFFISTAFFLLLHDIVGRVKKEYQWIVKLVAGIAFYLYNAGAGIIFLLLSIVSVFYGARCMDRIAQKGRQDRKNPDLSKDDKKLIKKKVTLRKRCVLFGAIIINLGMLLLVKYTAFPDHFSILLPMGISFYTFMAISYLVDVYGEKYESEGNIAKVALYLSWFPQMLQGPINRFDHVGKSLFEGSRLTYDTFKSCVLLFIFGAMKKYALANVLAPCVNEVFLRDSLADLPGSFLLFTAFLFAIEQYADFSGGIDMVMAVSGLFGVKMNDNFRQPYFSKSISEFWRRWHISLGQFLRDYVFYPFALLPPVMKLNDRLTKKFGKHAGRSVVAGIGNLLVFLLVGLWHGRALHYIVWGLYNGIIIAASDLLSPLFARLKTFCHIGKNSKAFAGFQMLRTFFIIVLAGYFDAVTDVSNGLTCFKNTFTAFRASELKLWLQYLYDTGLITDVGIITAVLAALIVLVMSIFKEMHSDFLKMLEGRFIVLRWAFYFVMIYVMLFGFASAGGSGGFMYAAF